MRTVSIIILIFLLFSGQSVAQSDISGAEFRGVLEELVETSTDSNQLIKKLSVNAASIADIAKLESAISSQTEAIEKLAAAIGSMPTPKRAPLYVNDSFHCKWSNSPQGTQCQQAIGAKCKSFGYPRGVQVAGKVPEPNSPEGIVSGYVCLD